jgi:choline dehydrogenase
VSRQATHTAREGEIHLEPNATGNPVHGTETAEFNNRVAANQRRLAAELQPSYDFIVCGSGSSGWVVARRLAETGRASVLLLDAAGHRRRVREARQWLANLGTERDWGFQAMPNALLNGRQLSMSMGKGARRRFEHQCYDMVAWTLE